MRREKDGIIQHKQHGEKLLTNWLLIRIKDWSELSHSRNVTEGDDMLKFEDCSLKTLKKMTKQRHEEINMTSKLRELFKQTTIIKVT